MEPGIRAVRHILAVFLNGVGIGGRRTLGY